MGFFGLWEAAEKNPTRGSVPFRRQYLVFRSPIERKRNLEDMFSNKGTSHGRFPHLAFVKQFSPACACKRYLATCRPPVRRPIFAHLPQGYRPRRYFVPLGGLSFSRRLRIFRIISGTFMDFSYHCIVVSKAYIVTTTQNQIAGER